MFFSLAHHRNTDTIAASRLRGGHAEVDGAYRSEYCVVCGSAYRRGRTGGIWFASWRYKLLFMRFLCPSFLKIGGGSFANVGDVVKLDECRSDEPRASSGRVARANAPPIVAIAADPAIDGERGEEQTNDC